MARSHTGTADVVQINGPALRAIRGRSHVSCAHLARAVEVNGSFLARIERGEKRGMSRGAWLRIAVYLAIDPRAILIDPYVTEVTDSKCSSGVASGYIGLYSNSRKARSTPAA